MPKEAVLNMGYPNRAKALLCLPLVASIYAVVRTLAAPAFGAWDAIFLFVAAVACLPSIYGFRSNCLIDGEGITRRSPWGMRRFRREDFLGHERIAAEPGSPPDLLLRFKTGVVFLNAGYVNRTAQEVVDFLRASWDVSAADYQPPELGAVHPVQCFEYETLHVAGLIACGVSCLLVVARLHVFGMLALVSAFCFRAAWRAMGSLETDEKGITFSHRFLAPVRLVWAEIESAAYWNSFAQGGVRIRDRAGCTIRVYRWIGGYPMLNRLMHDRLGPKVFWPTLQLPMKVDLNRRRRMGVLAPYLLLMVNALVLLWQGNVTTFAVVAVIPTFVAAALIWGSSRSLVIDRDGVRDIWRYMWFEKVNNFPRAELLEARLGRQLTVGGLWMRFGDTRLEIANSDASLPPEQILTCLREQWAWEQQASGDFRPERLRGAA